MRLISLSILLLVLLIAVVAIVMSPRTQGESSAIDVPEPIRIATPDPKLVEIDNARRVVTDYLSYAKAGKSQELIALIVKNSEPVEAGAVAPSSEPSGAHRHTLNLKPLYERMYVILSTDIPSLIRDLEFEVTSVEATCPDGLCIVSVELISKAKGKQLFHEYRLRPTDAGWKIYRVHM